MAKKGRGQPPYEPNEKHRKLIISYTKAGIPQADIGKVLELDVKTLYKYYRRELDISAIQANAMVGSTLFDMATSGQHPAATFFWGKTKMGLREKDVPVEPSKPTELIIESGPVRPSALKAEEEKKTGTE